MQKLKKRNTPQPLFRTTEDMLALVTNAEKESAMFRSQPHVFDSPGFLVFIMSGGVEVVISVDEMLIHGSSTALNGFAVGPQTHYNESFIISGCFSVCFPRRL